MPGDPSVVHPQSSVNSAVACGPFAVVGGLDYNSRKIDESKEIPRWLVRCARRAGQASRLASETSLSIQWLDDSRKRSQVDPICKPAKREPGFYVHILFRVFTLNNCKS